MTNCNRPLQIRLSYAAIAKGPVFPIATEDFGSSTDSRSLHEA